MNQFPFGIQIERLTEHVRVVATLSANLPHRCVETKQRWSARLFQVVRRRFKITETVVEAAAKAVRINTGRFKLLGSLEYCLWVAILCRRDVGYKQRDQQCRYGPDAALHQRPDTSGPATR